MREKILGLLGLMRRADAIVPGEDSGLDTVRAGKAKLLLLASDISDNARRKADNALNGRSAERIELFIPREELGPAIGLGSCSVAAVTDLGFAEALMKLLADYAPDDYGEAAERVCARREKAARRKAQKGSKRVGTRRKNV